MLLSSIAGVISIPYQSHYSSSKFAIEGLMEALRHEVAPFNIDVCLVEPGDTKPSLPATAVFLSPPKKTAPTLKDLSAHLPVWSTMSRTEPPRKVSPK